ncbi:gamma-glutamyltransferase [Kutzneria sp. 744]|uniref:gamma-glutamyltransferase n=1 Tax=Kutzneria sp. (strain 744) TaxID=345341 RepID=UPI0003EEC9C5|nr:gamma-glutamyltransferase [Kutzneria sp. 744]EWM11467.1 LigA protein [Kutzneria sp. 744]
MDPTTWDADEVRRYLLLGASRSDSESRSAEGERAMLVGSTGPFAQLAGRHVLAAGGSAVDAVITTALAQIALAAGAWVSYAGVFTLTHFLDGATESLTAGFATLAEEDDPASIPRQPHASGRTALVPGFMAGLQAAHRRHGRMPWADLFQPAIFVAERGFPVGPGRAKQFELRKDVLPAGFRAVEGEEFRQPELVRTLRAVAAEGAEWMYHGPWAREFVDVVRGAGGKATLADLAAYEPVWAAPVVADFHGTQVHAAGGPNRGGAALVEALRRAEGIGDPLADPVALRDLIGITRQPGPPGSHSDFVLAVDTHGAVAAASHSINTTLWGTTGLFAGGVSIPDSASFQQRALARLGPGQHLPSPANPAIVLRDGVPVLASSSVGSGMHGATVQCLHAVLGLGIDIADAVGRPMFHSTGYEAGAPVVIEDGVDADVRRQTEELGQPLAVRPVTDVTLPRGFWGGIAVGDRLVGARTPYGGGTVEGL